MAYGQIYPHGSTDTLPFATMGSGSLAAMSVFESKYREGLTVSSSYMCILYSIRALKDLNAVN